MEEKFIDLLIIILGIGGLLFNWVKKTFAESERTPMPVRSNPVPVNPVQDDSEPVEPVPVYSKPIEFVPVAPEVKIVESVESPDYVKKDRTVIKSPSRILCEEKEEKREKIDAKKLIVYSEMMQPRYKEY